MTRSIKVKGSIAAVVIVALSCFVAVFAGGAALLVVMRFFGIGGHSIEGMLVFMAVTAIVCIGLCAIFLPKALNKITDPLIELSQCSQRVAAGDFTAKVRHGGTDELGELAENFNSMVDELAKMEYLRKDFISSVSHEFKTPLSSIQGFAELLADESATSEERAEYSAIMIEETRRLNKLCSNMLRLSRLDSESVSINPVCYRLDEQIRRAIVLLAEVWQEKEIEFVLDLDRIIWCGDEELLFQVWLNLIENAIKFSEPDGHIGVSCYEQEHEIAVTVTNNGKAIALDEMARLYEKFYQGDRSRNADGNGLGLSIVARILELSKGTIDCVSESGKTTFTVMLPHT